MAIDGFVLEEYNITHLRYLSLIFPGDSEPSPGVFLFPEGVEEFEDNPPPGGLVLN